MATWEVVKAQARDILGINLTDADVGNVPLLATDAYGNFIKGPNGFPQVVMTTGRARRNGDPAANGGLGIEPRPTPSAPATRSSTTSRTRAATTTASAMPL